jgi:hypothetical protein
MEGQFRVGQFGQSVKIARGKLRDGLWQEQAAIFGKAHHDRLLEGDVFDLPASAEIFHCRVLGVVVWGGILAGV